MVRLSVERMTSLVFEIFQPLVIAGFAVLTVIKLVVLVGKVVVPGLAWLRDNHEDLLRRTLVFFGFVVEDENDDT